MIKYLKLKEMRSFWGVLFLSFLILIVGFIYTSLEFMLLQAVILVPINTLFFFKNLKLYKLTLGMQLEKIELFSIIENLEDGIVAYTHDFKVLIFNQAALRVFSLKEDEIVGQIISPTHAQNEKFRPLVQVFFPALAPVVVARSEGNQYPQIIDITLDQPSLELRVTTTKILGPNGDFLGFVKIIHDRTRELSLLKAKTEFISVAAHQLRTPLTSVHWASDILVKNENNFNEDDRKIVNMISQSAKKLLDIVDDLLNTAKIEEGRFGYVFDDLDLVEFINNILNGARDQVKNYGLKVYFDKPEDLKFVIKADGKRLEMALSNLIDNAVRYNVKNGEITVKLEKLKDKPYIQISVRDSGIGIKQEDLSKLFNKFYRGDNAAKLQTEGSGLGVFIAKNIVERHGGQIWAESELNRGTTFYFTLPTDPKLIPAKERVYLE